MTRYFTSFEDSDIGDDPPAGFTEHGTGSPSPPAYLATVGYGSPPFKRRQVTLTVVAEADEDSAYSIDAVDADSNRANVDVVIPIYRPASDAVERVKVTVRGQGAGAITSGYEFSVDFTNSRVRIYKVSASTRTNPFSDLSNTHAAGAWWIYRFRANGGATTSLKVRRWQAGDTEPSTWGLEVSDSSSPVTAAGFVGFGAYAPSGTKTAIVNCFSVATNGDSAVVPLMNVDYYDWLDSPNERRVLAELSALGIVDTSPGPTPQTVYRYLSNGGYTSRAWDSPASQFYTGCITKVPTFRREMSLALSGQATVGFGSLGVSNPRTGEVTSAGVRDDWLRMKWKRDNVKVYLGDPTWPKHDFRLIVLGRLGQPTAPEAGEIDFPITDLLGLLDQPFQTNAYSSGPMSGQMKPYLCGWVNFMEPVPISDSTLEQQLHDGAIEQVGDVYDDGVSLTSSDTVGSVNASTDTISTSAAHGMVAGYVVQFLSGTPPSPLTNFTDYYVIASGLTTTAFKLSATSGGGAINLTTTTAGATFRKQGYQFDAAAGTVTPAANPSGRLMAYQAARSTSSPNFKPGTVLADLVFTKAALSANYKDQDSFDALDTDLPFYCGCVFYGEKTPTIDAIARIAGGVNAWYGFTPDGLMQVGRLDLPEATAVMEFAERDVADGSLRLVEKILPANQPLITVTLEPNFYLNGPLNLAPHKERALLRPYLTQTGGSWSGTGSAYDTNPAFGAYTDLPTMNSIFSESADTPTEVTRLKTFYQLMLGVFEFRTKLSATRLSIGETISLTHSRLGWKIWTPPDYPSQDNVAEVDSRLAVVIGIDTNLDADDPFPVTLKVFRQIPGYYPES